MLFNISYPSKQLLLVAMICCICVTTHAQNKQLFAPYEGDVNSRQQEMVNSIATLETTKRFRVALIQNDVFSLDEIKANFFDDQNATIHKQSIGYTGVHFKTWTGVFPEEMGSAAMIINGKRVSGHITSTSGNFEIIPLDDTGKHLIIEHNFENFGNCGTEENVTVPAPTIDAIQSIQKKKTKQQGSPQRTSDVGECRIRLLIGYTPNAQSNTMAMYNRTMIEHIELAVLQMNQGYSNSFADQRVELAYMYKTSDAETGDPVEDILDLQNPSDGKWDEIHALRDLYTADMVALITDGTYDGLCGKAFGFEYESDDHMFQLTEFDCAVSKFTLAHEFGHLQGCRHDLDGTGTPFSFGHGYSQFGYYKTIMAVCCSTTPRLNYWSNPYIYYPGVGSMGTLNFNYNALVLNSSDSIVLHHRVTPFTIDSDDMLSMDHLINNNTSGLVLSSDTIMTGGSLILQSQIKIQLSPGFKSYQGSMGKYSITPQGCADMDALVVEETDAALQRDRPAISKSITRVDPKSEKLRDNK